MNDQPMDTSHAQPPQPAVSIIIPVYNLEQYLDATLESVERQTFADFEAIVVDDGSKDGTRAVACRHAERDPRIVVVHKENGGVARARETALERARGRYVTFLDGDDLFEPEMLQRLVDEIERSACDVVCCDYKRISSSYEAPVRAGRTGEMSGLEFLEALLCNEVWGGLWGKLYRRSLFDGTIRHYPLRLWQDSAVNIQLFSRNPRVRFIDYVGYGYVQRAGSSNHSRLDFDYCRLYCETVSAELRRRDAELAGRADYLATLSTLRVYLTYFCKSRNPWAGDSDLARNLRRDVARYRREVRRHYSAARLALLDLDRWHALRPLVKLSVTFLRWRKSLERRLSR